MDYNKINAGLSLTGSDHHRSTVVLLNSSVIEN